MGREKEIGSGVGEAGVEGIARRVEKGWGGDKEGRGKHSIGQYGHRHTVLTGEGTPSWLGAWRPRP